MTHTRARLSLVEYGAPVDLVRTISEAIDISRDRANSLLINAGNRVASSLRLRNNPISINSKGTRASGFAGLIRLAPSLELEISPKFLGFDDSNATWREDFFFLSTLSRHGHIIASEHFSASSGTPRDLSTLVARSVTSMYNARKRRPLRGYRRVREADFFIDGDPDPVDLMFPSPEGFEQELIRFDRINGWNATIMAAAKELLPEVRDPSAVSSLVSLIEDLSPQSTSSIRHKSIPARHRAWDPLYKLAIDVLGGLGISYKHGRAHAPGYLVSTWRVWEDLITVATRLGFGNDAVIPQGGYKLGTKTKISTGKVSDISVRPDCVIEPNGTRSRIILDAKYKGHVEKGILRISESDMYEALAFAKATDCNFVVLAYPEKPGDIQQPVGTCRVFEKAIVGAVQIVGIQIESRHISKAAGLRTFSDNLAAGILSVFT